MHVADASGVLPGAAVVAPRGYGAGRVTEVDGTKITFELLPGDFYTALRAGDRVAVDHGDGDRSAGLRLIAGDSSLPTIGFGELREFPAESLAARARAWDDWHAAVEHYFDSVHTAEARAERAPRRRQVGRPASIVPSNDR